MLPCRGNMAAYYDEERYEARLHGATLKSLGAPYCLEPTQPMMYNGMPGLGPLPKV